MPPARRTATQARPEPFELMEARLVPEVPKGEGWQYEPKWDGFRCLALKSEDRVELQGKSGKSLSRFFPEVVASLRDARAARFVLDGELVIRIGDRLSFSALQDRLHPAASRIQKLSKEHPAHLIVFDCLTDQRGKSLLSAPFSARRETLEKLFDAKLLPEDKRSHQKPKIERQHCAGLGKAEAERMALSQNAWIRTIALASGRCRRSSGAGQPIALSEVSAMNLRTRS